MSTDKLSMSRVEIAAGFPSGNFADEKESDSFDIMLASSVDAKAGCVVLRSNCCTTALCTVFQALDDAVDILVIGETTFLSNLFTSHLQF